MRRSARLAGKKTNLKNDTRKEPNAKQYRLNEKTSKIATMDNGTMVEAFKYLNYYQLAKKSLVSKRFRNVIQTHRYSLSRLYVASVEMERIDAIRIIASDKRIIMFNKELFPEAYDEWVIRNQYSKQVSLESQVAGKECTHYDGNIYKLNAYADYKDPNQGKMTVLFARAKFNHENWPLFQHFVRLLSDPFVYINRMKLAPQNEVLNLLAGAINPVHGRLRCKALNIVLYGDFQKFINWINDHVCCDKFYMYNHTDLNHDQELLSFFLTGARCSSAVNVSFYDLTNVVVEFVKKFLDLKNIDEYQVFQSIESAKDEDKGNRVTLMMKSAYPELIVKEEYDEDDDSTTYIFEFTNDDIGKKLQLTVTNSYDFDDNDDEYEYESHFSLKIEDL